LNSNEVEICANCDREIGHLERGYVYENNVVCLECYNRLTAQSPYVPPGSVDSASHEVAFPITTRLQPAESAQIPGAVTLPEYAGFWRRFAGVIIDGVVFTVGGGAVVFGVGIVYIAAKGTPEGIEKIEPLFAFILYLIGWLYYASMESSSIQATLGKIAVGIIVTDLRGGRVSFARATGRHFAKFVSCLTLYIGFIMAGFTGEKQALHDMIAKCLVVKKA